MRDGSNTVEVEQCHSREEAIVWIAANQLGRRNLTPSQKGPNGIQLKKQLAREAKKRQANRGVRDTEETDTRGVPRRAGARCNP